MSDYDAHLIAAIIYGLIGFAIGWVGGIAEGRDRERKRVAREAR